MIATMMERCCANRGGMGPGVCSTACPMTTACTGITRAIHVMEVKFAGKAGNYQTVLIISKIETIEDIRDFVFVFTVELICNFQLI